MSQETVSGEAGSPALYRQESDPLLTVTSPTPAASPPNVSPLVRQTSAGGGVLSNLMRYMSIVRASTHSFSSHELAPLPPVPCPPPLASPTKERPGPAYLNDGPHPGALRPTTTSASLALPLTSAKDSLPLPLHSHGSLPSGLYGPLPPLPNASSRDVHAHFTPNPALGAFPALAPASEPSFAVTHSRSGTGESRGQPGHIAIAMGGAGEAFRRPSAFPLNLRRPSAVPGHVVNCLMSKDRRQSVAYPFNAERRTSTVGADRRHSVFREAAERRASLFLGTFGLPTSGGAPSLYGDAKRDWGGKMGGIDAPIDPESLRDAIAANIEETLMKQDFLMKLCKAFWMYGSPSYRLDHYMSTTSEALEVEACYAFFPGLLLISFGDPDTHTSETHFLKTTQGYDMHRMQQVQDLVLKIINSPTINVDEAIDELDSISIQPLLYPLWTLPLVNVVLSFSLAILGFGGDLVTSLIAGCEGLLVGGLCYLAQRHKTYTNLLEISAALLVGFIARVASSAVHSSCFWTLALSGIVNLLPGLGLAMSVTELSTRNIVIGSSRMFYSLIVVVMLGFGLSIGSRSAFWITDSYDKTCPASPLWAQFLMFPVAQLCFDVGMRSHYTQFPIQLAIGTFAFAVFQALNRTVQDSITATAVASFALGVAGNVYARFTSKLAMVPVVTGVLIMVPGGLAFRGAAAFLGSDILSGTAFTFQVVQVAMAITVGLFVSNLLVFPIKRNLTL